MIPIKLTLKGIHSYRDAQTIDFSRLTEAGLFGIFGKVGSGKSTILEAISFVLFGEIERLDRNERNYNLTNLRSDRLHIEFECRAGRNNNLYRFVAQGRRNSKQFDKILVERTAYQWMDELKDWSPIGTEKPAEKIIGLSYDNFKRTIIIPQGRFQDFIDLTDSKRTEMMKELFRLERYDLADKAGILKKENQNLLTENKAKIDAIGDVSDTLIEQKQQEITNTKTLLNIENQELKVLNEQWASLEKLRDATEKLNISKKALEQLNAQSEAFQARSIALKAYEYALVHLKSHLDRRNEQQQKLSKDQISLENKKAELNKLLTELQVQTDALEKQRPQYASRHELKNEADELKKIAQIKKIQADKSVAEQRILKGEALLKEQKTTQANKKLEVEQLRQKYIASKNNLPDTQRLSDIRAWFVAFSGLTKNRDEVLKEANNLVDAESKERAKITTLLTTELQNLISQSPLNIGQTWVGVSDLEKINISTIIADLETFIEQKNKENEASNREIVALQTQKALQHYSENLEEGQPCPLCGSVHHPSALSSSENFDTKIQNFESQQDKNKKLIKSIQKTISELQIIEANLANFIKNKTAIRLRFKEKNDEITTQKAAFVWPEFDIEKPELLEKAVDAATAKQKELEILEKKLQDTDKEILSLDESIKTKYEEPLQKLRIDAAGFEPMIQQLGTQLQKLQIADFENIAPEKLQEKAAELEKQHDSIGLLFEKLDKEVREKQNTQNSLAGELKSLEASIETAQKDLKNTVEELRTAIENSTFDTEIEVVEILNKAINIESERADIQHFEQNLKSVQDTIKTLLADIGDAVYEQEKHIDLKEKLTALTSKIATLQKEEGRLLGELELLTKQFAIQKELQEQRKKLETRQTDIDLLQTMFKANGFVNYVSSVYLQNLCKQANERFYQMTRQQLQLETYHKGDGKYDFQVRDLLNDGRTRALSSLSGGQKFQASLSLALALADSVHTQNEMKENFFFLDEGFGSLDRESLQIVFETLKSLRRENRIVGIISHVEELKQEIDRYLVVENNEETGSVLKIY